MKDNETYEEPNTGWFGHRPISLTPAERRLTLSEGIHVEWREAAIGAGVSARPVIRDGIDAVEVDLPPDTGWVRLRIDLGDLSEPVLTGLRIVLRLDRTGGNPGGEAHAQAFLGRLPKPHRLDQVDEGQGRIRLGFGEWTCLDAALVRPGDGVEHAIAVNLVENTRLTLALAETTDVEVGLEPAAAEALATHQVLVVSGFRSRMLSAQGVRACAVHPPVYAHGIGGDGFRLSGWVLADTAPVSGATRILVQAGAQVEPLLVSADQDTEVAPGVRAPCGFSADVVPLLAKGAAQTLTCHLADAGDGPPGPAFARVASGPDPAQPALITPFPEPGPSGTAPLPSSEPAQKHLLFSACDETATDPYQRLLYRALTKLEFQPGGIDGAIAAITDPAGDSPVALHLTSLGPLLSGAETEPEARRKAGDLARRLAFFVHQGGTLVWSLRAPPAGVWAAAERGLGQAIAELGASCLIHSGALVAPLMEAWGLDPAPEQLVIAPHGGTLGHYPDYVPRETARARLDLPPDAVLFLLFGRLTLGKGIEAAVAAFARLREDCPQAHLLILGNTAPGDARGDVRRRFGGLPHVRVVENHLADNSLQWFFRAADWALMPYAPDHTPAALMTAMSFGLPVIAPSHGMIPEVLPGAAGLLYDPSDRSGLGARLTQAVGAAAGTRAEKGEAARDAARALSWEPAARALEAALDHRLPCQTRAIDFDDHSRDVLIFGQPFPPDMPARTAILILNYEEGDDTARLIASLEAGTDRDFDIYVIDNCSPSITTMELAQRFGRHRILRLPQNLGYAAGNNAGLRLIRELGYEHVLILNPDLTVPPDTLERLVAAAEAWEGPAVFGPALLRGGDSGRVASAGCHLNVEAGLVTGHMYPGEPPSVLPDTPYEADFVTGAAMFFSPMVIDLVGTIPEEYFLYFEESDWLTRARAMGVPSVVRPDIRLHHHKRSEAGDLPAPYFFFYYIRNALVFAARLSGSEPGSGQTQALLQSEFIQPWLARIGKAAPDRLEFFERLARRALADGTAGRTGRVDLVAEDLAAPGLPTVDDAICTGLQIRFGAGDDGAPRLTGRLRLPAGSNPAGPWILAAVKRDQVIATESFKAQKNGEGKPLVLEIRLPDKALTRGQGETLTLYLNGQETGSVSAYLPEPALKCDGKFVSLDDYAITGWLRNKSEPGKPLEAEILQGDVVVGRGLADLPVNQGNCGFSIRLPRRFADGMEHTFTLRVAGSTEPVAEASLSGGMGEDGLLAGSQEELAKQLFYRHELWFGHRETDTLPAVAGLRAETQRLREAATPSGMVSILMPVMDAGGSLDEALSSVIAQTHTDWELLLSPADVVIADALSPLIERLAEPRVRLLRPSRTLGTAAEARNAALAEARAEIIAHLDVNNRWEPEFLAIQLSALEGGSVFCGEWLTHRVLGPDGLDEIEEVIGVRGGPVTLPRLENRPAGSLSGLVIRRAILEELGGFDPACPAHEDWELMLRLADKAPPRRVPVPLMHTDIGPAPLRLGASVPLKQGRERVNTTIDRLANRFGLEVTAPGSPRPLDVVLFFTDTTRPSGQDLARRIAGRITETAVVLPVPGASRILAMVASGMKTAVAAALDDSQPVARAEIIEIDTVSAESGASSAWRALEAALAWRRVDVEVLLLRAQTFLQGGAVEAMLDAALRCPDAGIVGPRHIVNGRSPEARTFQPSSWREQETCIAVSGRRENLIDPELDPEASLIDLAAPDPFCLCLSAGMAEVLASTPGPDEGAELDALLGQWAGRLCLEQNWQVVYAGRARAFEVPL